MNDSKSNHQWGMALLIASSVILVLIPIIAQKGSLLDFRNQAAQVDCKENPVKKTCGNPVCKWDSNVAPYGGCVAPELCSPAKLNECAEQGFDCKKVGASEVCLQLIDPKIPCNAQSQELCKSVGKVCQKINGAYTCYKQMPVTPTPRRYTCNDGVPQFCSPERCEKIGTKKTDYVSGTGTCPRGRHCCHRKGPVAF